MDSFCRVPLLAVLFFAALSQGRAAEALTEDEVDRALDAIWLKSPTPEQRSPASAKSAALEAYLARLGPGTGILTEPPMPLTEAEFPPLRFHSEVLAGNTGYIRMGAFTPELPSRIEPVLRDFVQMGARNLILDLRATPAQGSLALAADVASCFVSQGVPLFAVRSGGQPEVPLLTRRPPTGRFRLLVLTGIRTAGPVEALGAALKVHANATLIGSPTQGQAADFEMIPLGSKRFLRLPVREAVLPTAPDLFPKGLRPDILSRVSPDATDAALQRAAQEGKVASLLVETERPRLNEAALVAGENPETEAWIQAQLRRGQPKPAPMPKDFTLRMALDFLCAWESLYDQTQVLP